MPTDYSPAAPAADVVYHAIAEIRPEGLSPALGAYRDLPAALAGIRRHARLNRRSTPNPILKIYRPDDRSDVVAVVEAWRDAENPASLAGAYRVFEAVVGSEG
jgi:hypothetical protein